MTTLILVFCLGFILLTHIALENWVNFSESKEFKNFLKTLKEGNTYQFHVPSFTDDPFDEDFQDTVNVLQIKINNKKDTWVKVRFSDNCERTMSAKELYSSIIVENK